MKDWCCQWTFDPKDWSDNAGSLDSTLKYLSEYIVFDALIPRCIPLCNMLRDLPWVGIIRQIVESLRTSTGYIKDVQRLSPAQLTTYMQEWSANSKAAKDLIAWRVHTAKELTEASRFGAWLMDTMLTNIQIERGVLRAGRSYIAIHSGTYKMMVCLLNLVNGTYCSNPNNIGNLMESLGGLAFNEGRYLFIVSIAWWAAIIEHPTSADTEISAEPSDG